MKSLTVGLIILQIIVFGCCQNVKYHNNKELWSFLRNFTGVEYRNGLKTRLYSIGKSSTKGTDLWVVEITASPAEKLGIPNVKLIGTIHGNEPVGREILLAYLTHLRDNFNINKEITWLLQNTKIHILPTLNPDGFEESQEEECVGNNGRKVKGYLDLNRNFPDVFQQNFNPECQESRAIKNWMQDIPFILSAGLHGGAVVANYPYDTSKDISIMDNKKNEPSLTPDNDVFRHLALTYANNHLEMFKGNSCGKYFENGVVNGAAWYSFNGGMSDYNYAFHGCMELTLEISCCKYPPAKRLPRLWQENKNALTKYCTEAHRGVTGQILDESTQKPIRNASLKITGREMTFFSTKTGEFWRLLLPGRYNLEVTAFGYYNKNVSFVIKKQTDTFPKLKFLKVLMINSSILTTTTITTTTMMTTSGAPVTKVQKEVVDDLDYFEEQPLVAQVLSPINSTAAQFMPRSVRFIFSFCGFIVLTKRVF